jgi:hypothetical protein
MDTDLEKINELRSETQKLMRKLWEASQEYTPSTDLVMDVLQATQPPPVLPRMPVLVFSIHPIAISQKT